MLSWIAALSSWAISAALPSPAIISTFSVPARRPPSCPPPCRKDGKSSPNASLTYRAATPFGAPNLCPTTVSRSTPSALTSTSTLPRDWAASVCMQAPRSWASSAMAAIGCRAPISLLLCMTDTSTVSSRNAAATASRGSKPSESTATSVYSSSPSSRNAFRASITAGCSMLEVTTCGIATPASRARFTPA